MARREIVMEELVEVLYQWHKRRSISQIKRSLGIDRKTIRKYIGLAEGHGFSRDMEVEEYADYLELAGRVQKGLKTPLAASPAYKATVLYESTIEKLLGQKYMVAKQVYRILMRDYDYGLSYSSFKRYMNMKYPKPQRNCLRIEVGAAEEAQVDFGSAGMMYDPETERMRRAHAFVMTLSYSRHHYVEFVFDQGQVTWVKCHIHAFEYFGGVVGRVILDNLKSGILKPSTYDPVINKAYGECGKHYGFIIDPAKVRMAAHKGKVERKMPVVRQQFLSSGDFKDIKEANKKVVEWCINDYGMQVHGTTKRRPYEVFSTEEKSLLSKLPEERFEIPLWKEARVHPDHHIVFDKSYYSLPTRYVGKKVWVRGGMDRVQVFWEGELIKTHKRSDRPGTFNTDESDYPPEKSKYLLKSTAYYDEQASVHGEHVRRLINAILGEHAYRNLRKVQGIFRLAKKYGSEALDLTSKRCLHFGDYRMSTIRRALDKKTYLIAIADDDKTSQMSGDKALCFMRPSEYFDHTKEVSQ